MPLRPALTALQRNAACAAHGRLGTALHDTVAGVDDVGVRADADPAGWIASAAARSAVLGVAG